MSMSKKILFIIIVIVLIIFGGAKIFHKKENPYVTEKIRKGDITQIVSVTGEIKRGDEINLSFQKTGIVKEIYVKEGERVKKGDRIASLDTSDLEIQLESAKSNLKSAQASYQKLIEGAEPQKKDIAQIEYENAKKGLDLAQNNLDAAQQKIPSILSDAFSQIQSAYNLIESIFKIHFKFYTKYAWSDRYQDALLVQKERDEVKLARDNVNSLMDDPSENSLRETINYLDKVRKDLKMLEIISSEDKYFNEFSADEKQSIITLEQALNLSWSNATDLYNNIQSLKTSLEIAKGKEEVAERNLSLLESPPRKEDVGFYQAKIDQAKSQISLIENQINQSILKSPIDGEVIQINKKVGEYISSFDTNPFTKIISGNSVYVEANVPESDIAKVSKGNECLITLDAFPEVEFSGNIFEIDPAPSVIGGVVYYKVKSTIGNHQDLINKMKVGMTANLDIITAQKKNIISIPQRAIFYKDGKKFVRVLENGILKEKEVKTGIRGSGGEIEIISGLKEGESLVTSIKK